MKNPKKQDDINSIDNIKWFKKTELLYGLTKHLITCVTICAVGTAFFYFFSKSFGKSTKLDIGVVVNFLASFKVVFSIALTGSATAWALVERYVRKKTILQLAPYKTRYEMLCDPNRSSSGLALDGTTNAKDKE